MKSAWLTVLTIVAICVAAVSVVTPQTACADSWMMPGTEITESPNGDFRFTVEPSDIGSQLQYFSEEVQALEQGEEVERPAPIGMLEERNSDGDWEVVWTGRLVNPVAPVRALVADDGAYVVTFDNWYSVGHGEHVIVIYGADGALVRSMALTDLVPQKYKDALPHSVSSLRWKANAEIQSASDELVIDVLVPGESYNMDKLDKVEFRIALSDGAITPPTGAKWESAQCAVDALYEQHRKSAPTR